ncbi:MAG: heme biosynthesis HemY N-terminal domain-containing protein [Burkholderiaceae bacterium]
MRIALWLLGLFAVAVAAALFAGSNPGSITLFWPPYRIDLSLNLFLVLLLATFLVLHLAWRALSALLAIPREARIWRLRQRERGMQLALLDAITQLAAGRFVRARKSAESVLVQIHSLEHAGDKLGYAGHLRAVAHLLVAEATHALQDRSAREQHHRLALEQAAKGAPPETREGIQLRAASWALQDRDAALTLQLLDELGQGAGRRTLALRLRLKAARMTRRTLAALETARLLAKHRAMSETAAHGVLRGLAVELIEDAHDPAQLQRAWSQLETSERTMPDVAIHAAERLIALDGDRALGRQWLLPVWDAMQQRPDSLSEQQCVNLVRALERGFAGEQGAPDVDWLTRIETAQLNSPGDAVLQYLAGVTCMRLQLWGKARQLLTQALTRLRDVGLRRDAWRLLAELAQQHGDVDAATQAWRSAAQT